MPLREAMLTRTLVELADTLVADFDVVDVLTMLVDRTASVLEVDAVGLMMTSPDERRLALLAHSGNDVVTELEQFQIDHDEGPCIECFASGQPVINTDLAFTNGRWAAFAPKAIDAGFRSVHAIPLRLRDEVIGAFNMFHVERGDMSPVDVSAATALADMATIAVLQYRAVQEAEEVAAQLRRALDSRVIIEQAKGRLAERAGFGMGDAFAVLRQHSRSHNIKLADLSAMVVNGDIDLTDIARPRPPRG